MSNINLQRGLVIGFVTLSTLTAIGLGFPFVAAGAVDPCEATARVVVRKSMGGPPGSPAEAAAAMMATRQASDMLRERGTLACYSYLAKALRAPDEEFRKRAGQ
jgi:hypothetical protein